LIIFRNCCVCLLKIKMLKTISLISQHLLLIKELLKSFIFSIFFKISLKIVSISLLLFWKRTTEKCVCSIPSFFGSLKHSCFSPSMIFNINIFSRLIF
jgi:hypothetical protein